jgi:hypothetical protein
LETFRSKLLFHEGRSHPKRSAYIRLLCYPPLFIEKGESITRRLDGSELFRPYKATPFAQKQSLQKELGLTEGAEKERVMVTWNVSVEEMRKFVALPPHEQGAKWNSMNPSERKAMFEMLDRQGYFGEHFRRHNDKNVTMKDMPSSAITPLFNPSPIPFPPSGSKIVKVLDALELPRNAENFVNLVKKGASAIQNSRGFQGFERATNEVVRDARQFARDTGISIEDTLMAVSEEMRNKQGGSIEVHYDRLRGAAQQQGVSVYPMSAQDRSEGGGDGSDGEEWNGDFDSLDRGSDGWGDSTVDHETYD